MTPDDDIKLHREENEVFQTIALALFESMDDIATDRCCKS
jgi:hypothetical protein